MEEGEEEEEEAEAEAEARLASASCLCLFPFIVKIEKSRLMAGGETGARQAERWAGTCRSGGGVVVLPSQPHLYLACPCSLLSVAS